MTFLASPPRLTEKRFAQQVVDYAALMGWRCYRTHDSRHSPAGWPDLVLIRRPKLLVAELKADRGRLTDAQRDCIDELRACGVDVRIWRPSMWEEVERCLR